MATDLNVTLKIAVIVVSDSCYGGRATDTSGANIKRLINDGEILPGFNSKIFCECLPDECSQIEERLIYLADASECHIIFTTGGTGFSPRDVTPEATKKVIEKEAQGLSTAMLMHSLSITPKAMLSRQICGIRGSTLIINLPGSKKASEECLYILKPALSHGLEVLNGWKDKEILTHKLIENNSANYHTSCHHRKTNHPYISCVKVNEVASRCRKSPYPLISVEDALKLVLNEDLPLKVITLNYKESIGQIIADDVFASHPLPPFRASIKDGYAVYASDGDGIRKVIGESSAGGDIKKQICSGECLRINTGAPIPEGSDAVVQVEDTELTKQSQDGKEELEINIKSKPFVGQDIRPIGCDIKAGDKILSRFDCIGPIEVGLLASTGVTEVPCYASPKIGIMSTGNELIEADEILTEGKIRDSNRPSLISLLKQHNFDIQDLGVALDDPNTLYEKFTSAFDSVDVIVTSGGVSMGDKDLLKEVLINDMGAHIKFGRVFMKPGKPTAFATLLHKNQKKVIFCLPGNPVSAVVTCHLYVLPFLRKMTGQKEVKSTVIKARLDSDIHLDLRPEYYRCKLSWQSDDGIPTALGTGNQVSSRFLSMKGANALLVLPPISDELTVFAKGSLVDAIIISL